MKRMKLDKTCTVCMILLLTVLLAACGRGSNQGAVTTIGAMAIDTAYLSTKYGFLAFNNQNDKYELVQYKYDGEMITETVLVSASSEADYKSQADQYLADARELKAYALDDRTPFGDEAAE